MRRMHIQVKPTNGHQGILSFGDLSYQCALGKTGVSKNKQEGDHASPSGTYPLRAVYFRADKLATPETVLKTIEILPEMGWCDDLEHPDYNKPVTLPFTASHETLMRDDDLYDIIVILGHNDDPPVRGKGSCIFMHVAKGDYEGTEGCVALKKKDLIELLKNVTKDTKIEICLS